MPIRHKKRKPITSLQDIQAGDEVYSTSRYQNRILKVDRTTKTQIICGSEKFNRDTGYAIPMQTWNPTIISILTDEKRAIHEADIKKAKYASCFKTTDWKKLTLDSLSKIYDIIQNDFINDI